MGGASLKPKRFVNDQSSAKQQCYYRGAKGGVGDRGVDSEQFVSREGAEISHPALTTGSCLVPGSTNSINGGVLPSSITN